MSVHYVSLGNVIVDDIVLPDGTTRMNTLGGGGTHAVAGMRVWTRDVGFVAAVGWDFDPAHRRRLAAYDIDLQGLVVRRDYLTPRAWQLFEPDERRVEVFRTDPHDFEAMQPTLEDIPPAYRHAKGIHILWSGQGDFAHLITHLKDQEPPPILLWEPSPSHIAAGAEQIRRVLPYIDVFSPNYEEARELCGLTDVDDLLAQLIDWGAPVVALRLGREGSAVRSHHSRQTWHIPAVRPARLVDVTGAGNAYCGGFLVGYVETGTGRTAGLYGAVSASFALEQFGIPRIDGGTEQEARRRLAVLQPKSEPLSIS